jgi:hypothetical protein
MIHVKEMLACYFPQLPAGLLVPNHVALCKDAPRITYTGHGLTGHVNAAYQQGDLWHLTLFVPDRSIGTDSKGFCLSPLESTEASRMKYYMLYLNVVAYLSGLRIGSIKVNQTWKAEIHPFDYKPKAVAALVKHFSEHHKPRLLATKTVAQLKSPAAPQLF